jgi:hypothetical protein
VTIEFTLKIASSTMSWGWVKLKCLVQSQLNDITLLKAGVHFGDYRSKLVPFEAQKFFFYVKKGPSSERFMP